MLGPHNQLKGPKNETQTEREKTVGEQNITDYDKDTKEAVGEGELTQTEEVIGEVLLLVKGLGV